MYRFKAFLLALFIFILTACPAYAVETPSDAEAYDLSVSSPSNARNDFSFFTSDSISLASDGGTDVVNTVDLSKVRFVMYYKDTDGNNVTYTTWFNKDGTLGIQRPSDYASMVWICFAIDRGALPGAGKYNMDFAYKSHIAQNYGARWYLQFSRKTSNVANDNTRIYLSPTVYSGEIYFSEVVELGANVSTLQFYNIDYDNVNFFFNVGGQLSVRFTYAGSDASAGLSSPGADNIDQDLNQNIANNTSQIVAQGDTIIEQIQSIITTISFQLAAFWDQLAGEFTNLYNKMNAHHDEQLANDNENTQEIIDSQNSNTTTITNNMDSNTDKQIANDNKNTDTITNGYDSSQLDDSTNDLDSALSDYDSKEDEILDSVTGYIDDFQYPAVSDYPDAVLSACIFCGNWLHQLFLSMGSFNLPVTLSLTMIFVLMLLGYHRFRT